MRRNKRFKLRIPGVFAVLMLTLAAGSSLAEADDRVAAIFGQGGSIFDETNEDAFETEKAGSTEDGSLFGEGSIFDEIRENALSGDAGGQAEDEDSIFKHVDESALDGASGRTGEEGTAENAAGPWFSSGEDGAAAKDGDAATPEEVLLRDAQTEADAGDGTSVKKSDGDETSVNKNDEEEISIKKNDTDGTSGKKEDGASESKDGEAASEAEKTESAKKTETGVSLEIPVQVKLSGDAEGKEARFSIRLLAGKSESAKGATIKTPMPDSTVLTVDNGKEAAFGPISFTRAGTYRYAVAEDVPSGAVYNGSGRYEKDGVEYDTARYEVEVRVAKGDDRKLTAELYLEDEPAGTLTFQNTAREDTGVGSSTSEADGGASGRETAESGTESSDTESISSAASGQGSSQDGSIRVYLAFLIIGSIALVILLILMRMR